MRFEALRTDTDDRDTTPRRASRCSRADLVGTLTENLQLLNVIALAVYVGAMLTEGMVLVPYWRALPPNDFFTWYRANDERLVGFFGPLTVVPLVLAVATAGLAFAAGGDG